MFPGLFGHFAAWENLLHVHSFFRSLVASDPLFPFLDDLVATFLTQAMRFQSEFFERFTLTKDPEQSLKKSVTFLSKLHFSVFEVVKLPVCKSGFEKAVHRLIGRTFSAPESFYKRLIKKHGYIKYPKVAFLYAMRSGETYPVLFSAADAALMPIVAGESISPSFHNFIDDSFSLRFRYISHGEAVYTGPNVPVQGALSVSATGDPLAGSDYFPDGELSDYGLSRAMAQLAADRATQAELARRTLAVDLLLRDMERAQDVLERGAAGWWASPPLQAEDFRVAKDDGSVSCAIVREAVERNREWLMQDVVTGLGRVGRELKEVDEAIDVDVRGYFPPVLAELFGFVMERARELGRGIGPRTAAGLIALAEWLRRDALDVFTRAGSRT
jgi:hypothetical protein